MKPDLKLQNYFLGIFFLTRGDLMAQFWSMNLVGDNMCCKVRRMETAGSPPKNLPHGGLSVQSPPSLSLCDLGISSAMPLSVELFCLIHLIHASRTSSLHHIRLHYSMLLVTSRARPITSYNFILKLFAFHKSLPGWGQI